MEMLLYGTKEELHVCSLRNDESMMANVCGMCFNLNHFHRYYVFLLFANYFSFLVAKLLLETSVQRLGLWCLEEEDENISWEKD